jgi:hypothetical protein
MPKFKKFPEEEEIVLPKPWAITQADIDSITGMEKLRGTDRFLPPADMIPDEFWGWPKKAKANIYWHMADCLYTASDVPAAVYAFNDGFEQDGRKLFDFLMGCLRSLEADTDHKIAGTAFIISKVLTMTPENSNG